MKIIRSCLAGIFFISLFCILESPSRAQGNSWSAVYSLIDSRFPNIPTVEIDVLEIWKHREDILLIDVREKEEFLVSHLMGAKNRTSVEDFQHTSKDKRMVLYCSVGYRSAKLVHALKQAGFSRVYNLRGSIFAWANAGKPVYRTGKITTFVHPYNEIWGQLLDKKYHPTLSNRER